MATADSREEGQPRSAAALFRHAYDKRWGVYCPLECAGPSELAACAQDLRAASGRPPLMKPVDRHEAVLLLRQLQQEGGDATPLGPVLCSQAGSAQLARLLALFVPNTAPQEAQPPLSGRAFLDQIRNSACTAEDRLVLEALRAPGHAPVDMSSTDQSASGARSMPDSAGAHACSNDQHSDSSTPNFPDGGVTVNIMEGILRDERIAADSTTDIVCHTIIKPATVPPGWEEIVTPVAKPWGTLYQATYKNLTTGKLQSTPPPGTSCLCDKLMAAGHRGAGKANVFFSHAWKFKFVDVVAAMRTFVDREAELGHTETFYFWFDTVVVDEHASQSFPPEWWETAFAEAVACIGHTCLMMTPWNAPIVITRAWCLWEVYCTMKAEKEQGCRFTLALSPIEQAALLSALARDGVDAVLKPFAAIDCRKAQATNPDDLSKILAAIRAGPGYDQLNAAVLERQRVWVMDTVSTYLQDVEIRGETRDRNTCCLMLRHVELLLEMGQLAEAYTVCATSLEIAGGLSLEFADGIPTGRFISTTESGGVLDSPDDVIILQLQMCIVRVTKMDTLKLIELVHTLMESFERVCGASHELTLSAQAQLASAQLTRAKALTRKPTEARLIFEELIPGMVSVLGPQHKKTLSAMNTYGGILGDQYYQEQMARPIFQATVDGYLATMGPSHPNTLTARANLARTLEQLGETETAQREYELVLAGDIVQLGEDHLSCLQDRFNLAMLLKNSKTGKLEAAISLLQQCVDGALRNPDIGKNHEFTIFVTSLLKQSAAAVSKFTQSQRIATGADSTGQHGNSITPELLPVSETWVRFTCNDRCFYVHKSTKKSLTAPAEGITTDIAVGDPRIPISEEYFEQHFTHLVARQRKVDANLLNPDSSWVKYTNSGCEFQLMRLTGHAGNPYYERRFEQPHQQQLHPPTEGVYDDIDGNHPDAPSDSDFVETVRTLIDEKRRAAALTDGLGPASAHRRAQHGRPVRSYVPGAAVQQPKFATFMWGCPFPADSTQTYQVRVNDDDSPMVKATTLNDTQTPCLLSLTVGFPEGEIDCFAYRAWRAYELKNAVHAAAILVENHSSPELTGLYKLVEHSYVKKDVCYKKESPQMFFYYNFIVKKWLVSKTFCSAESTDACCFLSCEDGLSVPAGSRKWRGKVNKAWQDVRMTVSELATQEDLADCKKRLQDKAIAEKAAAAAEKAAAAAAAAAARQQASELVAFVIEEHLHPKMNGVYSKMGEHKGFPYYQNTNGVYCYRYVSANKWFIRQDKFEPDSAVRNSEISATDGPLPVGTQQWMVWSNGADVVHKVKVSTLATVDSLQEYEQCVRDKMAADRERATRALEESFTAQERNGLVGLRHIRGPPDAVSIASDRTITFSKSFATVGSPQVLGNDQLTHFFEVVLVKMPPAGVGALQIGWAAADFDTTVRTNTSSGVGDDEYSWSIDGIRGRVYGTGAISSFKESEWKQGDVVGCGITSSGELIFGRNGKYDTPLGIAFQHVCAKHGLFPAISGSTKSGELVVRPNYGDRHPPFRYASPNLGKFNLRHFKPIQSSFYSKRRSLVKFFRYDVEGNQLAVPGSGHAYWPPAESVFEQHVTEYATKLGEDHEMTLTLKWKLALLKFGCNPYQWVDHPDSDVSGFDVSDLRCAVKLLLEIVDSATRNGEITEQSRHDGPRSLEAGFNPCRPSQYKFWLAKWEEVLGRRQSIDELQRAPGSFVQGVSVTWTGHDNDIPAGSVGEVIGYNQKGCRVKFPNGTWTFKNEQLRPVTADPAAAKSSSVEPASNMDGGVDEIDEAATIPVSLAGADRLFEQHLDRMSLHRIRQLADPARAIAQTPRFCAGTVEAERQHVLDGMITRLESYGWQVRGFVERLWELGAEVPREQLIAADIDAASRHLLGRILDDTVDAVVARPSSMFKNAERLFERDPVSFRRILQLANPGAALGQVPRFCMGTIEAERQHALNGIIAQLEANGWQVRRSIERLWELGAEAPREQLIMADVDAASRHLLERILASCDSRSGPVTAIAADQAAAKPTTAESVEQLVALGFDAAAAASALGAAGGDVQVAANMLLQ
jgi:hypothetical protein